MTLSASAPHASSWLLVVPSLGLGFHLDPAEFQIAVMWWLGMNSSIQSVCPFCPNITLDPLGHHAVSCRHGGDVVIRHNRLRNIFAEFCRHAHLSVRVEVGQGLSRVQSNSRPADVLVDAWKRAKPAAFDATVTSLSLCMTSVIPIVLQFTKQSAESTLPMTRSVRSWGGYVFLWQWNHMGNGAKRLRTPLLD